ncbi:MAG: hypothetical protein R3E08_01945 [Thiotrichaceae bacterium]
MTLRLCTLRLLEFPGCAVVISHDRWFLDHIATSGRVRQRNAPYARYAANANSTHCPD